MANTEAVVAGELELISLAAVIPLAGPDPERACALAGIRARGQAAIALVDLARVQYGALIDGDPAALDRVVRAGIVRMASVAAITPEAIAPGHRPQAAFVLGRLRESMGLTQAPRFSAMRIVINGPGGRAIEIGPTNGPKS